MKLYIERLREANRKAGDQLERAARAREKTVKFSTDSDVLDKGSVVLLCNRVTDRMPGVNTSILSLILRSMCMKYIVKILGMTDGLCVNRVHLWIKPRRLKAVTPSNKGRTNGKDTTTPVCDRDGSHEK